MYMQNLNKSCQQAIKNNVIEIEKHEYMYIFIYLSSYKYDFFPIGPFQYGYSVHWVKRSANKFNFGYNFSEDFQKVYKCIHR